MNIKFNDKTLTDSQSKALIGSTLGVATALFIRHRFNVKVEAASVNAVANWIAQNQKAGFEVLILSKDLINQIDLKLSDVIPAA